MNIKHALQNPFALVLEGFVAGAILLWTTSAHDAEAQARQSPQAPSVIKNNGR